MDGCKERQMDINRYGDVKDLDNRPNTSATSTRRRETNPRSSYTHNATNNEQNEQSDHRSSSIIITLSDDHHLGGIVSGEPNGSMSSVMALQRALNSTGLLR